MSYFTLFFFVLSLGSLLCIWNLKHVSVWTGHMSRAYQPHVAVTTALSGIAGSSAEESVPKGFPLPGQAQRGPESCSELGKESRKWWFLTSKYELFGLYSVPPQILLWFSGVPKFFHFISCWP